MHRYLYSDGMVRIQVKFIAPKKFPRLFLSGESVQEEKLYYTCM
jgi:hypothetical protein